MQSESITEADRIAVINLFKEIAEFGRRVRQRRTGGIAVANRRTRRSDEAETLRLRRNLHKLT